MDKSQSFKEFLATQTPHVPLGEFLLHLALAAGLAWALGRLYVSCGQSLSNRRSFARNFLPITMTTLLVITIVKASLALSLGLVGALSIVRFRAAIKEPEELAFLFLAIGVGLGLGAGQVAVTLAAFAAIAGCLAGRRLLAGGEARAASLYLTVAGKTLDLDRVVKALDAHCAELSLKRFDEGPEGAEAAFAAVFDGFERLRAGREALRGLDPALRVSFLESEGPAV